MTYDHICVEREHAGRVTRITLGPPPGNLISARLVDELGDALGIAAAQVETAIVVIIGAGDHFSYGASVEEHRPGEIEQVLPRFHQLVGDLLECPVPTLAAVSGLCLGGGFELAMSCSLLFCEAGAKFGLPEIKLGVFPPVASVLLPRLMGRALSTKLILGGNPVDASVLQTCGAVSVITEAGHLDETVTQFIRESILDKSASSLRLAHRATREEIAAHYRTHIPAAEKLYLEELMSTPDAAEGVQAFLEKRAPRWTNDGKS